MSMPIVQHVLQKSQTKGSARTLLLTLAIHANDCCGVAWSGDTTLRREVNVSRQRIHELKNSLEASGELVIEERPGHTNLYFVAAHGKPLGPQGEYLSQKLGQHQPGCPLRWRVSAPADPPGDHRTSTPQGVSGISDTQVSEISDGGCQKSLTQQRGDNEKKKTGVGAPLVDCLADDRQRHHGQLSRGIYGRCSLDGAYHQPGQCSLEMSL
jgi:hypothetical protein